MCGIVGVAGKVGYKERQIFKDLMDVCQVRGRDGSGVVRVKPNNEYTWVKRAGSPSFLFDTKMYDREIDSGDSKVLIGHCRAKTVGDSSTKNSHPFDFPGKVCGVHNGTLKAWWSMKKGKDFDVDSECLYWHISENGLHDTIRHTVDKEGAWALVFWDAENNSLNFLRNDQRPLFFTHNKDKTAMFWASEPWMFNAVSRKTELWDGDEGNTVYALPVDTHWKFTIDSNKNLPADIFTLAQPVEVKAEGRGHSGNFTHVHQRNVHGYSGNGGSVTSPFQRKTDLNDDVKDLGVTKIGSPHLPQLPAIIHNQGGSTTTTSGGRASRQSSQTSSVSSMESKNSTDTHRKKLSLVENSSKDSLLGHNGGPSNVCGGSLMNSRGNSRPLKLVSYREVLGQRYITDNKTGTEYEERTFDELTGSHCCFCRQPIGDLDEVHEIFYETNGDGEKEPYFVCTTCVVPAVA